MRSQCRTVSRDSSGYTRRKIFRRNRIHTMRLKGTALAAAFALIVLAGCDRAPDSAAKVADSKASNPALGERWQYPRERIVNGRKIIVYAPQIRSWDEFKHFTAQVAVEFTDPATDARYAVIDLSGDTVLDRPARLVKVAKPIVDRVTFSGGKGTEEHEERIRAAVQGEPLELPLDVFLYYLADGVLESPPPAGFNDEPPPIFVTESPAFLLFVNGTPVTSAIGDTGLELISNANFPVFRDTQTGMYYLLSGDYRYAAAKLTGPWGTVADLPTAFRKIPARGEFATLAAVAAAAPKTGTAPTVITTPKPAEIVVLDGKPKGRPIAGADGLESIANTDSPLFRLDGTYYLLASGRWFSTKDLQRGPWKFAMPLPDAFAKIPGDDDDADIRASVPGTLEARRAVLEAELPQTKTVKAGAAPDLTVAYAGGEPKFEPIPQTQVARAVNTGNDIIQYGDKYYLCYEGMWYVADKPTGPWAATADVPAAVYQIPPSSPAYPVTQVIVQTDDDGDVESSYNGAYAAGMFIGFGVAYYGTGWYYPPYYYGGGYYPYYPTYGHGSWYNPNTGGFGSRSTWYGPYGGYSYNQGYNPRTGRASYVETAWDGNEWASSGGTYNPRTGISSETDRHYGEGSNEMKMDRTVEGPRGGEMDVKKRTDFDTGTRTTERTTSRGGQSDVTRQRQADGSVKTSGTFETAGGKSGTISGEHERGQGTTTIKGEGGGSATIDRERNQNGSVSREGSFTGKDGQTVNTETRRDGRSSVTKAEGSGGGQAISANGPGLGNRTTIAESGSGDIYAGHDGNVYRKTDSGWEQHGDGGWSPVDTPDRPEGGGDRPGIGEGGDRPGAGGDGSFDRSQLDSASRDAARDRASQQSAGGQRYGGSGSLESRSIGDVGAPGSQGGYRTGAGNTAAQRPATSNYNQLNRDAAARSGGYQNYERRTAPRTSSMNRGGGGFRPRRR
jgi:hypothetical protein